MSLALNTSNQLDGTDDDYEENFRKIMVEDNPLSALAKHM